MLECLVIDSKHTDFWVEDLEMPEKALNFTWRAFFSKERSSRIFLSTKLFNFDNRFIFAFQNLF